MFEVTEGCNLRCAYCGFSDLYTPQEGRSSRNLPYSFAESLLSYLFLMWEDERVRELPISTAISFYGGEPLLNFPLIESIIAFVERKKKSTNRAFTYSLTTNATLLPDYGVPLGKLDELIHTLIRREIDTRGSWFFTRDKTPCRSCRFKYLCPSPSIYEIQMNEYDTCFLSTKCG